MNQVAGLSPEMCDMVIQTLRDVVKRDLPDEKILELDTKDEFPLDLIRKLLSPDVGLHLIFLPESAGGLGGGARDICRVSEEMAAVDLGVATAFLAICLGTDPILVGGTETQKSKWLSKIAGDGLIVAYGVTEPEAGSNVAALKTVAEPVTDAAGEVTGYRISGTKQFITNGGVAELYTILAKTPGGPSFFIVEKGTAGLEVGHPEEKHGIRASNTASVILDDLEVPVANLVGEVEGEGLKQANAVFGYTRLMVGAFGLGSGQAALDRALAYSLTRRQFGAPLIDKEGYALKLIVPAWVDLAAGRAYVEETALRIDGGEKDLQVEGSIAKLWCTEAGLRAASSALQALGGYGYTREYMVEKYVRDVRITCIYEGTSEIQQNIIGLFRWKETVRSGGGYYEEAAARMATLNGEKPDLGAGLVADALHGLNAVIRYCHKAKLTRHQMVLFEMADLATEVEVAAALTRKAARLVDAAEADAELFSIMSRVTARNALAAVRNRGRLCCTGLLNEDDPDALASARSVLAELGGDGDLSTTSGQFIDMNRITGLLKEKV